MSHPRSSASRTAFSALRTPSSAFRLVATAEAITWTLLIAALIVRAAAGWDAAVSVAGGIHGFVFLSYGATAILVALNARWPAGPTIVAVVSAVVPYATIPVERWLERRGRLAGTWRTHDPEPGEEQRWYDGMLRWFLRRPWALVLVIAAAVIALFVVLLLVGRPGGRH